MDVPAFFVPAVVPDNQEEFYAQLVNSCHGVIPPKGRRIYSITYVHDGEEWTATVGKTLRGTKRKTSRANGTIIERTFHLSDPATVLAISPGSPYMVVTNAGNVRSA